jgi:Zn-dependent peptidase ImmA (M78 family)/transcriptional regulator with XRE-family HTH domain
LHYSKLFKIVFDTFYNLCFNVIVKSGKQLALNVGMPDAKTIGRTIRALRMRLHLTQGDFAARLGMLQAPVSNIEGGKNFPSAQVLYRISKVLGVTLDELFNPSGFLPAAHESSPTLDTLKPSSTSDTSIDGRSFPCEGISQTTAPSLLSEDSPFANQVKTVIADYLRLEQICKVPREARIPLQIPFDLTAGGITRLASQVRDLMGIRNAVVFDHLELFENHGLRIVFLEMPSTIESLSFYDANNRNVFIFISAQQNPERQIFSLVLELGKILLHVRMMTFGLVYPETAAERWKPARLFAAAFLMPEETVRTTVTQTGILPDTWDFEMLLRLKHRFGVSAETFNYRLLELGLITPQLQKKFRTRIKAHYQETHFKEPGSSRRILSPNGRIGDLLHIAFNTPEGTALAKRFKKGMKVAE